LVRIFRKFLFSTILILALSLASYLHAEGADSSLSPEFVSFCASAPDTDTDMNITIREDGSISGEFFMSECGSGPIFGYAQINIDPDDGWRGKLFIYTDILGGCSIPGAFYSVDVPDLLYRWHAGPDSGLIDEVSDNNDPYRSGAGILELLECAK
jgi:hypothetical protein